MIYAPHSSAVNTGEASRTGGFRMGSDRNGRIAGSIPVFDAPSSSSTAFSSPASQPEKFSDALALQSTETRASTPQTDENSFGFFDLLDIINPLQHLPIISSIYREVTGDKIGMVAEVLGGAIFGGPAGAAVGLVSAVVTHETGKEPAQAFVDFLSSPSAPSDVAGLEGTTIAFADLTRTRSPYNE